MHLNGFYTSAFRFDTYSFLSFFLSLSPLLRLKFSDGIKNVVKLRPNIEGVISFVLVPTLDE